MVSRKRSLVKALTYRSINVILMWGIGYLWVGSVEIATKIAIFDILFKGMLYYVHERFWAKIHWEKNKEKSMNNEDFFVEDDCCEINELQEPKECKCGHECKTMYSPKYGIGYIVKYLFEGHAFVGSIWRINITYNTTSLLPTYLYYTREKSNLGINESEIIEVISMQDPRTFVPPGVNDVS